MVAKPRLSVKARAAYCAPGLTLFVAVAPSAQYAARALTERRGFATIAPSGPRRLHPMDNLLGGEGRRERGQALGC